MIAHTVANILISEWTARFCCSECITTEQEYQFESELFHQFVQLIGAEKIHISPYHPQLNGLVDNCHLPLKCVLRA